MERERQISGLERKRDQVCGCVRNIERIVQSSSSEEGEVTVLMTMRAVKVSHVCVCHHPRDMRSRDSVTLGWWLHREALFTPTLPTCTHSPIGTRREGAASALGTFVNKL